jgi:hypothetical protein
MVASELRDAIGCFASLKCGKVREAYKFWLKMVRAADEEEGIGKMGSVWKISPATKSRRLEQW